ncbi:MAG TPA: hypothetical protein VIE69_02625 [Methylophilaceae bacterium]|jgi:predicted RNA-binding protein Jag
MFKLFTLFITCILFTAASAFAEDAIDAAAKKLQIDVTKMQADIAAEADKNVLLADKQRIKSDKSALKAARQTAKSELIKGHESN